MQTIVMFITIFFFLVMIGIGYWASKKTTSTKEYLVAGQSLGFFVMAIATFSSIQSGWGMYGTTGTVYSWGIQGILVSALFIPLGFVLAWFLLGTRLRRMANKYEIYSVPDIIRVRYGSRAAHVSMSIAIFLGSIGYMTSQITAMGFIMSLLFNTSFIVGAWIGAIVVAIYTILGGMLAAVWTDLIQGILMIVMSVVVFFLAMKGSGGWSNTLDTLYADNPAFLSIMGIMPLTYVVSSAIMNIFGAVGQPQLITKFLMLKDEKELKWGASVAILAYVVTTFFSLGVGLSIRALVIQGQVGAVDNPDLTTNAFLMNDSLIHPLMAGIALTAILSAIMSSASSFITIGASAAVRDLAGGLRIKVKRELLWSRIFSAVVVLLALLFGLYLDQIIYLLGSFGWAMFGAATVGPIVIGIYWRKATGIAATISIVFGLIANLVITIFTANGMLSVPNYFFTGGVVLISGLLVFIVASLFTKSAEDEKRFDELYPDLEESNDYPMEAISHESSYN